MKIINLLPQSEVKALQLQLAGSQLFKFFSFVFVSLVVVFLAALASRFYIEGNITQNKSEVVNLQQQLSDKKNQELEKQVQDLNTQIRNVKLINDQHYYWSKALVELGNVTPTGMHISQISFDRPSLAVSVTGYADHREDVIQFWSNVKKSDYFTKINFPLNNLETANDTLFTFSFSVKPDKLK